MDVTLYTRVWIEITLTVTFCGVTMVTLYTRVWIEMSIRIIVLSAQESHPLHEGVD